MSALYYQKNLYADADKQSRFKEKYDHDPTPPDTWQQVTDQVISFGDPSNFYGTRFAGKDEAIVGRSHEMVVAEGGALFNDDWSPAFSSVAAIVSGASRRFSSVSW